jgi:hypothetical protein
VFARNDSKHIVRQAAKRIGGLPLVVDICQYNAIPLRFVAR